MQENTLIDSTVKFVDRLNPILNEVKAKQIPKYENFLQEGLSSFVLSREWSWWIRRTELTIDSNGQSSLPSGFLEVGKSGSLVYYSATGGGDGLPFDSRDIQELVRLFYDPSGATLDKIYAIGEGSDAANTRKVWVPRGWSGRLLTLAYRKTVPTINYNSPAALVELPEIYAITVMQPYLRFRGFEDRGDPRATFWYQEYEKGVNDAARTDREGPQMDTTQQLAGSGFGDMY